MVTDPSRGDVIALNGTIPEPAAIAVRVQEGAGLTAAEVSALLSVPLMLEKRGEPLSLIAAEGVTDPLLPEIVWGSAP